MKYFFKGYADRYTVNKDWSELCREEPTPYRVLHARDELNRRCLKYEKDVPELFLQKVSGWPIRDCEVVDENGETVTALIHQPKEFLN